MPDISFLCKSCNRKLRGANTLAGKRIRCPDCGSVQLMPGAAMPADSARSAPIKASPSPAISADQRAVAEPGGELDFAERESSDTGRYRYEAFISYRHRELDRQWARWLHAALETYRVPRRLVRERGLPDKLQRVFRDEEEMPASADLSREIDRALEESRFLIVICSPATPKSKWVNQEVQRFRQLGRHDRILALLIDGEPEDSFPPALREIRRTVTGPQGASTVIEEVEPLAADVRPSTGESLRLRRKVAQLRLIACLIGCRFDDLWQRERLRQRQRRAMGAVLAALVVAFLSAGGWLYTQQRSAAFTAQQRESLATRDKSQAERKSVEADEQSRLNQYISRILLADRYLRASQLTQAREILDKDRQPSEHADPRNWEWYYLQAEAHRERLAIHDERAGTLATFSPDGRWIASGFAYAKVQLWDPETGQQGRSFGSYSPASYAGLNGLAYSPDGSRLACVSGEGIRIFDTHSGKTVSDISGKDLGMCLAFSAEGDLIAISGRDETVRLWQIAPPRELWSQKTSRVDRRSAGVTGLAFCPGSRCFACGLQSGAIEIRDADTGALVRLLKQRDLDVGSLAFNRDGSRLVSWGNQPQGNAAETITVWDPEKESSLLTWEAHDKAIASVAYSPLEHVVASVGGDRYLKIWDAATGNELVRYLAHEYVRRVGYNSAGTLLITAGDDTIKTWDAGYRDKIFLPGQTAVHGAVFHPEGKQIGIVTSTRETARGSESQTIDVRLHDASTAKELHTFQVGKKGLSNGVGYAWEPYLVRGIDISPDGGLIAVAIVDTQRVQGQRHAAIVGRIAIHATKSGKLVADCAAQEFVSSVRFSSDGQQVIAACGNFYQVDVNTGGGQNLQSPGVVRVWDVRTSRELTTFTGSGDRVEDALFSPDNGLVAARGADGQTRIWDRQSGQQRSQLSGATTGGSLPPKPLGLDRTVAFRSDGHRIATANGPNISIWDTRDGKLLATLVGHANEVTSVAFLPDGKRIVSTAGDETLKVWNAEIGQEVLTLPAAGEKLSVSPDGQRIATWSDKGPLRIWDARKGYALYAPGK